VVVTATIANGVAEGTPYIRDFSISIVSDPAALLAFALNAIVPGSASASGNTVTLLADISLVNTTITVPAGVTLDLVTNHKSLTLGNNAVLTVNGVVNAEASHAVDRPAYTTATAITANGGLLVGSAAGDPATINGTGVIHLKSRGTLLEIENGKELVLDGVTLDGLMTEARAASYDITLPPGCADDIDNDSGKIVHIMQGGTFTMKSGVIGFNSGDGGNGGGMFSVGTFNMNGGELRDNRISGSDAHGGGICIWPGGVFTMTGGEITGNSAGLDGGGVIISNGTFTMTGGVIKKNRANLGGGLRIWADSGLTSTFTMAGGIIYGSDAEPGLANTGSGASLSSGSFGGTTSAYWGNGTTSIGGTSDGTLHGGYPTGTVE
jgi:hypothetical protein